MRPALPGRLRPQSAVHRRIGPQYPGPLDPDGGGAIRGHRRETGRTGNSNPFGGPLHQLSGKYPVYPGKAGAGGAGPGAAHLRPQAVHDAAAVRRYEGLLAGGGRHFYLSADHPGGAYS